MSAIPEKESALELIIDAIGLESTVRLVEALGGTRWYVSHTPPASALWVEVLGEDLAEKLRDVFRGEESFRIPRDKRIFDALIARDAAAGLSQNQLALKYRLDVRSVQNALRRHRQRLAEAAQGNLFDRRVG